MFGVLTATTNITSSVETMTYNRGVLVIANGIHKRALAGYTPAIDNSEYSGSGRKKGKQRFKIEPMLCFGV